MARPTTRRTEPAAPAISFVSATLPYINSPSAPNGSLCVKNGNGSSANKTFVAETVTFTVDNMLTTDTMSLTWTNAAGSASVATRSTSGGHTVFTFVVPATSLFSGSTSSFTFIGTRASDGAGINKVVTFPVQSAPNAPANTSSAC